MFHGAPWFRLSALELRLAAAHDFRFRWRQGVVGIHQPPGFDQYDVPLLAEGNEVPFLELEGFK
jgi:hypothetical protein